jgi:hypothetical protein
MNEFLHDDREEFRRRSAEAISARVEDWASDRMLDPGDTHDKGEPSLCVGEAA